MSVISVKTTSHRITTRITHRVTTTSTPPTEQTEEGIDDDNCEEDNNKDLTVAEPPKKEKLNYANLDIDELLNQLNEDEIEQLASMVDPDDTSLPPSERCRNQTNKTPTGPLNRRKLLAFIEKFAKEQEDWSEVQKFVKGQKNGKVWLPKEITPVPEEPIQLDTDIQAYANSLKGASESELVDIAAILGLHYMLSQDQYHASLTNNNRIKPSGTFSSVVKATPLKPAKMEPDNTTNPTETAKQVESNDANLTQLNWNNLKQIRKEDFRRLFEGLKTNNNLETLSICNTRLTDSMCEILCEAIKENKHLKRINLESNYISGAMIRKLIEATLVNQSVEEFRAANQRPTILGNKVEMDIAKLVEQNPRLLVVGLSFDVPDARLRIAQQLQRNKDRLRKLRRGEAVD